MKKTLRVAVVAFVGLLGSVPPPAYTGALRCRSDPAVVLSNLTVLDLSADIDAWLWDVKTVSYTLHVPVGVWPIAVIRTPNWPTTKETFRVIADQPAKTYDTTTVVTTNQRGVAVTANLLVNLKFGQASGWDRQLLRVMIQTR